MTVTKDWERQPLVMIVDDVPKNLQVLGNTLRKENYRISVAQNGRQALDMVENTKLTPDIILLDVMMPEMNGFDVCRELKENSGTRDIPVIFLTAKSDQDDISNGFRLGAVDYVTKPFNSAELLARVRTHLSLKFTREELLEKNALLEEKNKQLTAAQKELEVAARTDPLTKLPNRRDILEKIIEEKIRFDRSSKPFTLVLGDIDDFKRINDTYGHDCGDMVLVETARIMRGHLRKQDHAARWGGEEFLLLPETDAAGGKTITQKIREKIADNTLEYQDQSISVTMTFGVTTITQNCPGNIEECLKKADKLLYQGKQEGKNRVVSAGI